MIRKPEPIQLSSCPKKFRQDLDKAAAPAETVKKARAILGPDLLAGVERVDTGRLGIPVYLGLCGPKARAIMPVRKQMGKGASPLQAQASAIMEFVERYSFFSFWAERRGFVKATWSEAERLFGAALIPLAEILKSVNDTLPEAAARKLLDLVRWDFYPATDLVQGRIVWLPLDWFRMLGEFNGSSAGNADAESLLQGLCELVERHVCAFFDRERPLLAGIAPESSSDPVLADLIGAFERNGISLALLDMSLGMPVPTVGALAYDRETFPDSSEIVFTAGTATSPVKAAIRAITEVAQLGGDFCTRSCYEASGLPKFASLGELDWIASEPTVRLADLPDASREDMRDELICLCRALAPLRVYAVELTRPELGLPAHYCIVPGLQFRERDRNQSLGLFIGRRLAENAPPEQAQAGLLEIAACYPAAPFLPFFAGMLALRKEDFLASANLFEQAVALQKDAGSIALAAFYAAHARTCAGQWREAMPMLERALAHDPAFADAANLLGVCHFKTGAYSEAESWFDRALKNDKGMAMALANRGLARKYQGKRELAATDLANALELEPGLEFAARHLAEFNAQR